MAENLGGQYVADIVQNPKYSHQKQQARDYYEQGRSPPRNGFAALPSMIS